MIFLDDKLIKVGGVLLPGLIKSLEIKDDAHMEEQEVEGSGRKPKQADGYEDAKITIEIILDDSEEQTKIQKLEIIQNLFKKAGQEKPAVYEIVNELTAARRVKDVVFKSLSTKQESKKGQLIANLEFWAYEPMTITAIKAPSGGSSGVSSNSSSAPSSGSAAQQQNNSNLGADYQSYLSSGNRGKAPEKTDKSPAVDNVAPGTSALAELPY